MVCLSGDPDGRGPAVQGEVAEARAARLQPAVPAWRRGAGGWRAAPAGGATTPAAAAAPAGGTAAAPGAPRAPGPFDKLVGRADAGANAAPPTPPRHVELRNLATGAIVQWQDIQSFTFALNSEYLVLRHRAVGTAGAAGRARAEPTRAARRVAAARRGSRSGAAAALAGPRGVEVTLYNLATGRAQTLASVADSAFNRDGDLMAYTVDSAAKDSNGLFVFDLKSGKVNPIENDAKLYNRLTWSEDGAALAVLKGLDVDKMRERDNQLIVYPNVQAAMGDAAPAAVRLDPAKAEGFPKNWVVSDRAALAWSDDNKRVFFSMKEQTAAPDAAAPRRSTDEVADVDVWNTLDERIQSQQMIQADTDRNSTCREADAAPRFVKLADQTMKELAVSEDGRWAIGRDTRGYVSDYKRPAADVYRVDTSTGTRTLIAKGMLTGSGIIGISPDSKTFLYWKDNKYQAYDLDTAATKTLGGANPVSFVDAEYDHPGPRPSYGIAGCTPDGKTLIVQQRYDLWALPLDGSAPKNLTNGTGTKGEIRFRYVRTEPIDPAGGGAGAAPGGGTRAAAGGGWGTIDLSKPGTLSAYGEYTKKAGSLRARELASFARDRARGRVVQQSGRAPRRPTRTFSRGRRSSSIRTCACPDQDFKTSKKLTDANPQQSEYLWGRRILFDFKDRLGHRLQGILALPDDYKPGEKRPMLVNFYELNSQNLNRYNARPRT